MGDSPAFPEIFEAGLKGPASVLMIGKSGTGRSFLTRKFALEALKQDENCLYFCTSRLLDTVRQEVGWVSNYENKGSNILIDAYPKRIKEPSSDYYIQIPDDFEEYEELLDDIMEEMRPDRTILDRFDTLPRWIGEENAFQFLKRIKGFTESCGGIGLYIVTQGVLSPQMELLVRDETDVTLQTSREDDERLVEITDFSRKLNPFGRWVIGTGEEEINLSKK